MSKHDNIHETPDVSYIHSEGTFHEHSDVSVSGIAKFTLGLFVFTVFTFGLMKLMQIGFERTAKQSDAPTSPMMEVMKDSNGNVMRDENGDVMRDMKTVLPPEPRLQLAPGFRYVRKDGKAIDLSLGSPTAEWTEFQKEYKEIQEKGLKDEKGNVIIKPIEEAQKEVLKQGLPVRPQATAEMMEEAKMQPSSSSSGRTMEVRRQ
jgi:hypothetical protein